VTAEGLVEAVRGCGHRDAHHLPRAGLAAAARARLQPGDIVITLGAGDVTQVGPELLGLLGA
jgi:UDP-N-acetylmuramate--alanine ligase